MKRSTLALLALAACGASHHEAVHVHTELSPSSSTAGPAPVTAPLVARSAGDVTASAAPDRGADEIARLRAEGPAALARLLAEYDRAPAGDAKARLAATIDKVAGQRFATVSRLYWYTDLAAAETAAHASGKPILALRMLGRLDEDLSCANSRFFRTILYANAELAPWLRDHFVLYWSSERAVPKVTIDFGDGRVLERTVTGNSAHFVLDADGHPLDVLPGLYAPAAFRAELTKSLALAAKVRGADDETRREAVATYHAQRLQDRQVAWDALGTVPVIYGRRGLLRDADVDHALALAQRATMSKGFVEVPDLRIIDVGADPGALAPDLELWAVIGQRLYGWNPPAAVAPNAVVEARVGSIGASPAARKAPPHAPATPLHLLDAQSTALVLALADADRPGVPRLDARAQDAMLARLDQTLAADTAQNELVLRSQLDSYLSARRADDDLATLTKYMYASVFHTPADDPWLGLLPRDAFTGLPADGIVVRDRAR